MRILTALPAHPTQMHLETVSAARSFGEVAAVSFGDPDLELLARYGVSTVYVPAIEDNPCTAKMADAIARVTSSAQPDAILLASTFAGKEIAGHLAVRLDSGAISDVVGLHQDGESLVARKVVFQGTWETQSVVTRGTPILTLKPTAFEASERPGPLPAVERAAVTFTPATAAVERLERVVPPESDRPALEEARVVIVGGRGTDGDFGPVEALADALGAAVGATRVATDEGWIAHEAQIGQTGVTISPKLYIGLGVSGAIHHTAGMTGAETVVAVNTDSEAPIFELADFGIVGDLSEVVPQILAALQA